MADSTSNASPEASKPTTQKLDYNDYSWSVFFRNMLGIATDAEHHKYRAVQDVLHAETYCKNCEATRDYLFKYSPIIRFLQQQIKDTADGPEITPSNVRCQICPPDWLVHGGFNPDYGIMICANNVKDRKKLEDTIAHEMVHAYDYVRFKVDRSNLRHCACTEIRAVMLSGECRFMRQWGFGQKFVRGWEDCVKRRAALAIRSRPECKDDVHAAKTVNEVWDSCSADTRPFDEVYR